MDFFFPYRTLLLYILLLGSKLAGSLNQSRDWLTCDSSPFKANFQLAEEDMVLSRLAIQTKSPFLLRVISQGMLLGAGHIPPAGGYTNDL